MLKNNNFTEDNFRKKFLVIINNLKAYSIRIEIADKTWEGEVLKNFIGKSFLNEMTDKSGARYNPISDRNSIPLALTKNISFVCWGFSISFGNPGDNILKHTSKIGINCILIL